MWDWAGFWTGLSVAIAGFVAASILYFVVTRSKFRGIAKYSEKKKVSKVSELKKIDSLNRCELAEDYFKSIRKMNESKMEISRFAIEGGYGYGKSFVIDYLESYIKNKTSSKVLSFKAWERDEYYSPTSRLLIQIINIAKHLELDRGQKRLLRKMIQHDKDKGNIPFKQYIKKYDFLFNTLSGIFNDSNKKLYIFIDELDRADPEDVIEFLEITNHFFGGNKNVILVYGYDKKNVKAIIKSHIGIEDDSYLTKFVDFTFKLNNLALEYLYEKISVDKELAPIGIFIRETKLNEGISLRDVDNWIYLTKYYKSRFENELLWRVCVILDLNKKLGELNKENVGEILEELTFGLIDEFATDKGSDAINVIRDSVEVGLKFEIYAASSIDERLKTLLGGSENEQWGFERILEVSQNKLIKAELKICIDNTLLSSFKIDRKYKPPRDVISFISAYRFIEHLDVIKGRKVRINDIYPASYLKNMTSFGKQIMEHKDEIVEAVLQKDPNHWSSEGHASLDGTLNRSLYVMRNGEIKLPDYLVEIIESSSNW